MQWCLIDKVVPILLVFTKELGFLLATSNKRLEKGGGQKTKIDEGKRDREARPREYPADGSNYISKGATSLVQSIQHGCKPLAEVLSLHALGGGVEGEAFQR